MCAACRENRHDLWGSGEIWESSRAFNHSQAPDLFIYIRAWIFHDQEWGPAGRLGLLRTFCIVTAVLERQRKAAVGVVPMMIPKARVLQVFNRDIGEIANGFAVNCNV